MGKQTSESVPQKMQATYDQIVALTDDFCRTHLNEEYALICRRLAAKLARKRPSPLESGKVNTWAAAIVHTIGRVNFLFDKSQTPHMRADALAAGFGLSKSTVGNKAKQIMDLLNIGLMEPEWTLPSKIDDNPMAWMVTVNGFIVDVRSLPSPLQEEAYRKGLIPYLPGAAPQ
ncbi:MAG: hypothetical protein KKA73_26440 [Chloroflexi bacterium]|nr:hypothetical protein [Chloroflexota bacterium]MBU1751239.1 hypothetical protein [Chloroflexota bacterium]